MLGATIVSKNQWLQARYPTVWDVNGICKRTTHPTWIHTSVTSLTHTNNNLYVSLVKYLQIKKVHISVWKTHRSHSLNALTLLTGWWEHPQPAVTGHGGDTWNVYNKISELLMHVKQSIRVWEGETGCPTARCPVPHMSSRSGELAVHGVFCSQAQVLNTRWEINSWAQVFPVCR